MKNSAGMEVEPTLIGQEGLEFMAANVPIASPTQEDVKAFEEKLAEPVNETPKEEVIETKVEETVQKEIEKTQEVS